MNANVWWRVFVSESVWEPPAEGFLSVAEQEAEEHKKKKDKAMAKKKGPSAAGPKAKKKKTDKEDGGGDDDDDDDGAGETSEQGPAPPVRGEFEPFMMETTRIGSWKRVEPPA